MINFRENRDFMDLIARSIENFTWIFDINRTCWLRFKHFDRNLKWNVQNYGEKVRFQIPYFWERPLWIDPIPQYLSQLLLYLNQSNHIQAKSKIMIKIIPQKSLRINHNINTKIFTKTRPYRNTLCLFNNATEIFQSNLSRS